MSSAILAELSPTRADAVMSIPLHDAIAQLRSLAMRVEIRYPNQILRVLHEFEARPQNGSEHVEIPTFLRIVAPLGPNKYSHHVEDPRQPHGTTFCGLDCRRWRDVGLTSHRDGLLVQPEGFCRRCSHSLQLAVHDRSELSPGEETSA